MLPMFYDDADVKRWGNTSPLDGVRAAIEASSNVL